MVWGGGSGMGGGDGMGGGKGHIFSSLFSRPGAGQASPGLMCVCMCVCVRVCVDVGVGVGVITTYRTVDHLRHITLWTNRAVLQTAWSPEPVVGSRDDNRATSRSPTAPRITVH